LPAERIRIQMDIALCMRSEHVQWRLGTHSCWPGALIRYHYRNSDTRRPIGTPLVQDGLLNNSCLQALFHAVTWTGNFSFRDFSFRDSHFDTS
uniref:Type VI secretion system baseplate subunit TssF n=1 Tax=Gongylonema pulchrum TaxID=637853 RepID=A0A183EE77_9BILA